MRRLLFMICAAALTASCQNGDLEIIGNSGEGYIAISASTSGTIITKADAEAGITLDTPTVDKFSLLITGPNNLSKSWASLSDYASENERFVKGNYTVAIECGNIAEEGYNKPYFYGEAIAPVPDRNKTVNVEVVASVGNAIVEIATTENFRGYFPTHEFKLKTATNVFELVENSSELLFIAPQANVAIECNCIRQANLATGKYETLPTQKIAEVKARTRYIVTYDLERAGSVNVTVTLNDTIIGTHEIDVELNENA